MSVIEEIFYGYIQSKKKDGIKMDQAMKKIEKSIEDSPLSDFMQKDILNNCVSLSCESEKQGFVEGFKIAMKLMAECMEEE